MSFILDALKKSESERRIGTASGSAHASTYMIAPGRRPGHIGFPLMAGAGMLVTGLVLGGWRPWQPQPPARINPAVAVVPAPAPASVVQPVVPAAVWAVTSPSAEPAKATTPPKLVAMVPMMPPSNAAEAKVASKPPALRQIQTAPAAKVKPAAAPVASANAPAAPVAVSGTRVVDYRELPAEIRGGLPTVVFGGYAGVDEAEVRIAFINNQLVKEGEEVSPGLKLEQVGREGVVLGYKGHHFRPGS